MQHILILILFFAGHLLKSSAADIPIVQKLPVFAIYQGYSSKKFTTQFVSEKHNPLNRKRKTRGIEEFPPSIPSLALEFYNLSSPLVFTRYQSPKCSNNFSRICVRGPPASV